MKKIIIYILVFIFAFFIFLMPSILLNVEDLKSKQIGYIKQNKLQKVDVQVENLYLVKAINDIESGNFNVKISNNIIYTKAQGAVRVDTENANKYISPELDLKKLQDMNVLKDVIFYKEDETYTISMLQKEYKSKDTSYIIERYSINNSTQGISIEIEKKTGKVIFITVPINQIADFSEKEIMENYIKYLDLYAIDDWKYENGSFKSERASLVVYLKFYDGKIATLSVYTPSKYYEVAD